MLVWSISYFDLTLSKNNLSVDFVSETEISPLDIAQVGTDVMVLKYNTAEKQFELNLFMASVVMSLPIFSNKL